jgi:hypothetical protein
VAAGVSQGHMGSVIYEEMLQQILVCVG